MKNHKIIVTGSGPDIGKTVVSTILTLLLDADYWKPMECGDPDSLIVRKATPRDRHTVYPPAYSFKAPLSPHHAAHLEGVYIDTNIIFPPITERPLIIETAGGIFVPVTDSILMIDLLKTWPCQWLIVSKHYLGSINHTLLTIAALKQYSLPILGIIFNGENPHSEKAILEFSELPLLGRLLPEPVLDSSTLNKYVKQWHKIPCLL